MKLNKDQLWDYFILTARILLGWTFLRYGYSKLMDNQFGVTEEELNTILHELSPWRISWYLFDMQPFKAFIGISQIICGLLLIIHRTAILGAFMFIPIIVVILIMDITFMPTWMAKAFAWRLSCYLILDFLILWHYKDRMTAIWNAVWNNVSTKFKHPIWMYLLLPVLAIVLEVLIALPKALLSFLGIFN